jgi:hypothetical protein
MKLSDDGKKLLRVSNEDVRNGQFIIPETVTSIDTSAFRDCTGLTHATIPGSVKSIGNDAFRGCASLTQVTIPDSVKSIGDSAFHGCTRLTQVTIPGSVTSIGNFAFGKCTSLTQVTIPGSVKSIGGFTFFGCTRLTQVTIPGSVTSIDDFAFYGCTGLTHITIPNSVTSISTYAFENCSSLQVIAIEDKDDNEYQRLVNLLSPAQQQLARRWSESKAAETIKQKALTSVAALSMNGLTAHLLFKLLPQNGIYKDSAPFFLALCDARYPALSGHNVVVSTFKPYVNRTNQELPRLCSKLASRFCLYPAVAQIRLPSSQEEFDNLFEHVTETARPCIRGKLLIQPPTSNPESDENAETDNRFARLLSCSIM